MSEIAQSKASIEAEFQKILQVNKAIDQKLESAKASGDETLFQSLLGDLRTMKERENFLQGQYSKLQEEEKKPELERIKKLGAELRGENAAASGTPYGFAFAAPKEQRIQKQREIIGELYKAPVGEGGVTAEQMPASVRAGVGALATPESELEYLRRTYPEANITPLTVDGQTEFLVKDKDGRTLTTLDKGFAGTAGMLAVEAPLTVAETAATLGTLGVTKSPMMATGAGAATRLVGGTAADMITRAALGMPQQIGENIQRRGTEAAIGAALGVAADVIPPAVIAARKPSNFGNEFFKAYQQSVKNLGLPPSAIPPGSQFGPQGLRAGQELAGEFPKSRVADAARLAQESVRNLFDTWKSKIPATANDFSAIAVNMKSQREALQNSITQATNSNKRIIEGAFDRLLKPKQVANIDDLGTTLQQTIKNAEDQAINVTNNQYKAMADIANRAGFEVSAKDMLDMIPTIEKQINPGGAIDASVVNGIKDRLRERRDAVALISDVDSQIRSVRAQLKNAKKQSDQVRLTGQLQDLNKERTRLNGINRPLDFEEFDAFIKEFHNARPDGGAVGGTTKDVFGVGISKGLSDLRKKMYSAINTTDAAGNPVNLGVEFEKATEMVRRRAAFEKNTLGTILKEAAGEQATTPRAIVNAAMKEPFTVDRILQAAKQLEIDDPTQVGVAQKLQDMMQVQYLDNIGMGAGKGTTRLDYDDGMLQSLYGSKAPQVKRGLDSLNEQLKALGNAKVPSMTLTDLNQLSSALSKNERDAVAKNIIKRKQLEDTEEALVASEIFKQAKRGDFKNIDPDAFAAAVFNDGATLRDVEIAMKQLSNLSPQSRNLFKDDFRRYILDRYPGGAPSANAPFTPIFDAEKFIMDYNPQTGITNLGKKIRTVLGEQDADFLFDLAKVYEGNTIRNVSATSLNPRGLVSPAGATVVLPISQVAGPIRRRYLAALLGTGTERYGLRNALANNALPGNVNEAYTKMFKNAFLTRQGLTALANQASNDPEFSAELVRAAREFEEKEGLNLGQE